MQPADEVRDLLLELADSDILSRESLDLDGKASFPRPLEENKPRGQPLDKELRGNLTSSNHPVLLNLLTVTALCQPLPPCALVNRKIELYATSNVQCFHAQRNAEPQHRAAARRTSRL